MRKLKIHAAPIFSAQNLRSSKTVKPVSYKEYQQLYYEKLNGNAGMKPLETESAGRMRVEIFTLRKRSQLWHSASLLKQFFAYA